MVSRSLMCVRYGKLEIVGFGESLSFSLFNPPKNDKDIPRLETIFLVGWYEEGCGGLHVKMLCMSTSKS